MRIRLLSVVVLALLSPTSMLLSSEQASAEGGECWDVESIYSSNVKNVTCSGGQTPPYEEWGGFSMRRLRYRYTCGEGVWEDQIYYEYTPLQQCSESWPSPWYPIEWCGINVQCHCGSASDPNC